jgi:hypothetical protein
MAIGGRAPDFLRWGRPLVQMGECADLASSAGEAERGIGPDTILKIFCMPARWVEAFAFIV